MRTMYRYRYILMLTKFCCGNGEAISPVVDTSSYTSASSRVSSVKANHGCLALSFPLSAIPFCPHPDLFTVSQS